MFPTRRDICVYSLDVYAMTDDLNASVEEKDSLAQVWHKRLGHISEAGLHVLEKQGLFGKKSLGRHTTQGVIDYVHSDLWGTSQVESLGGKRYFLSIVDDYSRRDTVKKLRTDNGLEFCNREFEQLCIESGIARHFTVVGTPQQNGVAERMNRTLMGKRLRKKTPMEMWSGHPSDYEMLMIFGCVAYPHDKQVTSRNVVFNESVAYKDTLKDSGACDKSVEELQIEVEL
ncbi:retrovirus-related pol polyprotein from transposon TNT 1-94 [Tanacetum coccineum]